MSDEFLERYVGGRGFGAKMVWDNLVAHDFKIDPLGPENLLVIAPGPLTGAYLPSSGQVLVRVDFAGHGRVRRFVDRRHARAWNCARRASTC